MREREREREKENTNIYRKTEYRQAYRMSETESEEWVRQERVALSNDGEIHNEVSQLIFKMAYK